jgi:hypothetical protein
MRTLTILPFLFIWLGCGPAALQTGTQTGPTVTVGGAERRITTLTDVDDVRDIAVGAGKIYVATDRGVVVYPETGDPTPVRISRATAPGLPSDEVFAVVASPDGATLLATARGLAGLAGDQVTAIPNGPPVGRVMRMAITNDGAIWACGVAGVARLREGRWQKFGEDVQCTTMAPTPEGQLWVGTSSGMWMVEGDVIREHSPSRGMPEAYVRDVVPVRAGQVFALLQGPSSQVLGWFDGQKWISYTIPEFTPVAIGLGRVGQDVALFTAGHAYAIRPAEGGIRLQAGAVSLRPLAVSEPGGVRSFGARTVPADAVPPTDPGTVPENAIRGATPLSEVPQGAPTVDAPDYSVIPLDTLPVPSALTVVRATGDRILMGDRGRGVVHAMAAGGAPRELRTRDLVEEMDLQIATDAGGRTWVLSRHGDLAKMVDDGVQRVRVADDFEPMALATGPNGAYVLGRVGPSGSTVRVVRVEGETFSPVVERTLTLPEAEPFVGVSFMGVAGDGAIWAAIDVARAGGGKRARGMAMIAPQSEAVVYFHRAADPATDGVGALQMPDEVSALDFDDAGNVWIATLSGAVRIGGSQAIVFGESRGVRGEVVSDLAVGEMDRVWIASAEGVGYYEDRNFDFRLPAIVREARPTALTVDLEGHLWGAGQNGIVFYDGQSWLRLTEETGLPTNRLVDVEVDGANRVWVLANDRVMVMAR